MPLVITVIEMSIRAISSLRDAFVIGRRNDSSLFLWVNSYARLGKSISSRWATLGAMVGEGSLPEGGGPPYPEHQCYQEGHPDHGQA